MTPVDLALILTAAVITGLVMALTPTRLRPVSSGFFAATTLLMLTQQTAALMVDLLVGAVLVVVMVPLHLRARRAATDAS